MKPQQQQTRLAFFFVRARPALLWVLLCAKRSNGEGTAAPPTVVACPELGLGMSPATTDVRETSARVAGVPLGKFDSRLNKTRDCRVAPMPDLAKRALHCAGLALFCSKPSRCKFRSSQLWAARLGDRSAREAASPSIGRSQLGSKMNML